MDIAAERDALMSLIIRENYDGRWEVLLGSVWPGIPGKPETYSPGRWNFDGNHWCFDNREDAVAAVRKEAGI